MLATRWPEPFRDPEWNFEIKWDGVRTILYWDGERIELRSRAGNDATSRYPEITGPLPHPVVLDGEVVAIDAAGRPSFERLQQRMNLASTHLVHEAVDAVPVSYVTFDVLYDGGDVTAEPLERRRERLAAIDLPAPMVRSDQYPEDPDALWAFVTARGMEGIVAKRLGSIYRPGARSLDWRKISVVRTLRAIVGGFTPGTGNRTDAFGSLLLGLIDGDRLRWIGSVGTGFDRAALAAIRAALDEMTVIESPFHTADLPRDAVWVDPQLVAVVEFKEWTAARRLRAPSFKGFSDDPLDAVTWEAEGPDA